jgi:hypothetical protein
MNIFPVTALSEGPIAASQWPEARSSDATDTPRADHRWSVPRVTTIAAGDSISQPRHARSSVDGSRIGLLSPLAGVVSIFAVGGVEAKAVDSKRTPKDTRQHELAYQSGQPSSGVRVKLYGPQGSRSSARPDCNSFRTDRARMDASSHGGLYQFTITETDRLDTLPRVVAAGMSPKGLGWDGNKPLMRNRMAAVPSPIGNLGSTLPARRNGSAVQQNPANANAPGIEWMPYYYPQAARVGRYRLAETYQPRESKSRLPLIPLPLSPLAGIAHAGAGFSLRGIRE